MTVLLYLLFIVACCLVIWRASDGFEVATEYLGRNLSNGVRGATLNAIGSSVPELFTTIFFLFILQQSENFASGIGTTAGSAIFNGMIIPASVIMTVIFLGVVSTITVSKKVILRDGLALIACELVLIVLISGDSLEMWHSIVLMLMYAIYVFYMFQSMDKNEDAEEQEDNETEEAINRNPSFFKALISLDLEAMVLGQREIKQQNAWILLIIATIVMGGACLLLVLSCEGLGHAFGVPVYFVAVILASAATSVPDTVISIKDAKKGNYDDAVANALGSNIFDICFALGFPLFLYTLFYGSLQMSPAVITEVSELRILLLIFTVLAFFIYFIGHKMGRFKAMLLFFIYLSFVTYIFGRAVEADWAASVAVQLHRVIDMVDLLRFW